MKPTNETTVADKLSNIIRQVDGNNTLGAGALAEAILEHPETKQLFRPYQMQLALGVLQRTWLKLNCGLDNEPDTALGEVAWDCICEMMGVQEAIRWSESVVPSREDDAETFWDASAVLREENN